MNEVRARALKLRLRGRSYSEIQKELGVAKSTLSGWFKDVVLSDMAKTRLASRTRIGAEVFIKLNKAQTHHARERVALIRARSRQTIRPFSQADLRILGAALYWAEGYKRPIVRDGREVTSHAVSFLNSDPDMIRLFIVFLERSLGVSRSDIRATMRLYSHINEEEARRYWMRATELPAEQFRRSTNLITGASKGKRPFNRLPYGTLQISVYRTDTFHEIMGLIEGMKLNLKHDRISKLLG